MLLCRIPILFHPGILKHWLTGYFNDHVGLHGDLRYFRSLTGDSGGLIIDPREFDLGDFDFWRGTVGVSFSF